MNVTVQEGADIALGESIIAIPPRMDHAMTPIEMKLDHTGESETFEVEQTKVMD